MWAATLSIANFELPLKKSYEIVYFGIIVFYLVAEICIQLTFRAGKFEIYDSIEVAARIA